MGLFGSFTDSLNKGVNIFTGGAAGSGAFGDGWLVPGSVTGASSGGGGAGPYSGPMGDPMAIIAGGNPAANKALQKQMGETGYKYLKMMYAYGAGMPQQYEWQLKYQPKYTQAALANTYTTLMGDGKTPGQLSLYEDTILPALTRAQNAANSGARRSNADAGAARCGRVKRGQPAHGRPDADGEQRGAGEPRRARDGLRAGCQLRGDDGERAVWGSIVQSPQGGGGERGAIG